MWKSKRAYNKSISALTPFDQVDPEIHREISSLGGVASGKARRALASARKVAQFMLSSNFDIQLDDLTDEVNEFRKWRRNKEKYVAEWEEFVRWRRNHRRREIYRFKKDNPGLYEQLQVMKKEQRNHDEPLIKDRFQQKMDRMMNMDFSLNLDILEGKNDD